MKNTYLLMLILILSIANLSAQSPHLFGVTYNGGENEMGTIFRTDTNGLNYSLIDTFDMKKDGTNPLPQELVEVNGKLYGVTEAGGNNGKGVLFEYNPSTNAYVIKHHFKDSTGEYPDCFLLLGSNGKLYGTTSQGGSNDRGALFEYDLTTEILTRKINFGNSTGLYPQGKMVEGTAGKIYGTCSYGGSNNNGVIFEYTISTNTIVVKDDFNHALNGSNPKNGLMKANNGKLYGMCNDGGANNYGTLFEFDFVADSIKTKFHFDLLNGRSPVSNLIQASNGKLYGTTKFGGGASGTGGGTLFEYNPTTDSLKKMISLSSSPSGAGYYPMGGLVESAPGVYLITMSFGGTNSRSGVVSEYTIATNTLVEKDYFDQFKTGKSPHGNLVKSSITNKYYGICGGGGIGDNGVIFEFDNTLDTIIKKKDLSPSVNGKNPNCDLILASNGKLYGTTKAGGKGFGVIFEVDPNTYSVIKKAEFNGNDGENPIGALVEVAGKLYGTTYTGGGNNSGVIFEYDLITNNIVKLKDLNDVGGYGPGNGLIQASNGKLYGTTVDGGTNYSGMLFEYDLVLDTLIDKGSFGIYGKGTIPYGKLLQATNGKLYGTCNQGGDNNKGDVYEYDFVTDSIKSLASFSDSIGALSRGGLMQTSTGKLFGMTAFNYSTATSGIVYEFDISTDSILPRADFDRSTTGYESYGELLEASNGKLYGMSRSSSTAGGVARLIEFDPITYNFIKKSNLSGNATGSLIEVVSYNSATIKENEISQTVFVYPNPTSSKLTIEANGARIIGVKVFTVSGQLIDSKLNSNNTIEVEHYRSGLYILQVETQNGIALSRFIKK